MTPDVNLGKLVPLEVHDRLKNIKIAKKKLFDVKTGCALQCWKVKEKTFPTS